MRSELGDKIRLQHISDAIIEIEKYIVDVTFEDFNQNSMMRFASIKQMEIIGEATNHLSNNLKSTYTNIDWVQIIGMRNVFVHEYFGIDSVLVWEIIKEDIQELKKEIEHILSLM